MNHTTWIETTTDGATPREIGRLTGISYRTIQEQKNRGKISAENVIKIAEAYDHHPVTALIDTGFLDERWSTATDTRAALRAATEHELADEVLDRMLKGPKTDAFTTPIDEIDRQ